MPFPVDLEQLEAAGYIFVRSEACPVCREPVEIFTTPGGRTIAMNPMCCLDRPSVRHYETCNNRTNPVEPSPVVAAGKPSPKPQTPHSGAAVASVAMFGVTDPNRQLLSVGWSDGTLVCQWAKGKGQCAGVPEELYQELRRVPFAYKTYQNKVKGKYPYTKLN